jgi:hypothetical protein
MHFFKLLPLKLLSIYSFIIKILNWVINTRQRKNLILVIVKMFKIFKSQMNKLMKKIILKMDPRNIFKVKNVRLKMNPKRYCIFNSFFEILFKA